MTSAPPSWLCLCAAAITVVMAGAPIAGSAKQPPQRLSAAERGYRVAARECAACHAIDDRAESPRVDAPPFRDIRRRYNERSFARELDALREVGHYDMPAKPISKSDGEDLIAYLSSWKE